MAFVAGHIMIEITCHILDMKYAMMGQFELCNTFSPMYSRESANKKIIDLVSHDNSNSS